MMKIELRAVIHQNTRWSPNFAIVRIYFLLLEFTDFEEDDLLMLLPAPAANKRLHTLFQELCELVLVSKALQGRRYADLFDIREWVWRAYRCQPTVRTLPW